MRSFLVVFSLLSLTCLQFARAEDKSPVLNYEKIILSDAAKVSVITCGPGDEIYSIFGHTALRIRDPLNRIDWVYNYGTFQFDIPNFYLKFAGGRLAYFLSVTSYNSFAVSYVAENRSLSEQVLNLGPEERQKIFEKVEENLRPENKYYYYQFFSDNCTTRIYELLKETLGPNFQTDTSYIQEQQSFRQLIKPHLEDFPWVRVGMNIGLGLEADHKTQLSERVFLPEELKEALDHSRNGSTPLVHEENFLHYPVESPLKKASVFLSPFLFLSVLAILVLVTSYFEYRSGRSFLWLDRLIFGLTGLLGIVLLLLWIFSAHTPTHQNLNILWLNPLNFLLLAGKSRIVKVQRVYATGSFLLISGLLILNLFYPLFIPEFYPIAIILAVRFLLVSGLISKVLEFELLKPYR